MLPDLIDRLRGRGPDVEPAEIEAPHPGLTLHQERIERAWRSHLAEEFTASTADTYLAAFGKLKDWIRDQRMDQDRPELNLATFGRREAVRWREEMKREHAPASVALYITAARRFYEWAIERGAPIDNPFENVRAPRGSSGAHKIDMLTDQEVRSLLATCATEDLADVRDQAMLSLMLYCGCRTVEIHRAEAGDLDTRDGRRILWVWGKGRDEPDQFVVLPPACEDAVRAWMAARPKDGGPLFVALSQNARGRRLSRRSIRRMVKRRMRACGIVSDRKSTHSLRHTAITNAIRNGATPTQVQAMARHRDVKTTIGYFHDTRRLDDPAEYRISYESEAETQAESAEQAS